MVARRQAATSSVDTYPILRTASPACGLRVISPSAAACGNDRPDRSLALISAPLSSSNRTMTTLASFLCGSVRVSP